MRIEHIAMYVNDLEKAREFFVKYFHAASNEGYHNKKTDFRSYFLSFEDGARLEIMNKPQMCDAEKALNRTGYIHIEDAAAADPGVARRTVQEHTAACGNEGGADGCAIGNISLAACEVVVTGGPVHMHLGAGADAVRLGGTAG